MEGWYTCFCGKIASKKFWSSHLSCEKENLEKRMIRIVKDANEKGQYQKEDDMQPTFPYDVRVQAAKKEMRENAWTKA